MSTAMAIEAMQPSDWADVRRIYAEALAAGVAAFMRKPPLWKDWDAGHLPIGRLVARRQAMIVGFAALSPVADT